MINIDLSMIDKMNWKYLETVQGCVARSIYGMFIVLPVASGKAFDDGARFRAHMVTPSGDHVHLAYTVSLVLAKKTCQHAYTLARREQDAKDYARSIARN
jgi:hypothetical protein